VRSLLDVNVLIALFQPRHVHHERAHEWWAENGTDGWSSCPLTQNAFVRIVTQPGFPNALSALAAIELLGEEISRTDHAFWPDDISLLDPQRFDATQIRGPKQLTDLYLLALAIKNDARLATFDRSISASAVRGAQARHLVVM
jgi:uncharacterized protein